MKGTSRTLMGRVRSFASSAVKSRATSQLLLTRGVPPLVMASVFGAHFSTTRVHAAAAKPAAKEAIITTPSGLQYVDHVVGTGEKPTPGAIVQVHYVGTLLATGAKFDSSRDRGVPLEFPVGTGRVIQGWDEGIMSMRVGGKRRLIVPPNLGYGARGAGAAIPPNASLIFEVELVECKPPAASIFESLADMIGMKR